MIKKTIIITGSTRGIGFALAKEFLKKGHNVLINGQSEESVNLALEALGKDFKDVKGIAGSVALPETHSRLLEIAGEKYPSVDVYINNAGIPQPHKFFFELKNDEIKKLVDVNIYGLMLGTRIAANYMQNQGFGKIFNMEGFGSDGRMMPKLSLYGTSKRAVQYFTRSFANEIKDRKVQAGILSPGMVRTDFLNISMDDSSENEKKQFEKVYRILAEDVEVVAPFLCENILKSTKNYDRISFLRGFKLIGKILRLSFA